MNENQEEDIQPAPIHKNQTSSGVIETMTPELDFYPKEFFISGRFTYIKFKDDIQGLPAFYYLDSPESKNKKLASFFIKMDI